MEFIMRKDGNTGVETPAIEYIQVDQNGQQIPNAQFHPQRGGGLGTKLRYKAVNALFGQEPVNADTVNVQDIENLGGTIQDSPRIGGLLNDLTNGYRENRLNGFNVRNWGNNELPNDREKGLAYRIGEGVGTVGRTLSRGANAFGKGLRKVGEFAETPLGRSIIVGGLVLGSGGGALPALAFGGMTGLGNQSNRMKDRAYRDSLINTAQQARMSDVDFALLSPEQQQSELTNIADRINGYRGYIGDDIYGQMIQAQQLRDNAQYRNMLLQSNMRNQEEMMKWRIAEAQRQARQDERDYNLDAQRLGLQARGLDLQEQKLNQDKKTGGNVANLQAVSQQLKRFEDSFKNMPNKFESNTLGRLRNFTGLQTETEANFNSQRQLLFNKIARDLGGEKGVLSDQDIKRIEGALPSYTDSYAQKQAKMQAIYDLLNDRLSVEGGSLGQTTQSGTTQVGKYKVRVK